MDPASWERLKGVISDALERPPDERQAFVRQRCADPAILGQALHLLELGETDPGLVAGMPFDSDPGRDDFADLPTGTRINQYEVLGQLGRGGMGQVFLCYDHELHRRVALKCLLSAGSNLALERSRIRAEAQAAAAITHPNVAAVYHVVEHGTRAFIVMEYVEGESLSSRLRRERLTITEAVTFARQLAAALQAAHARRVIHGDLKPGNVQVTIGGSVKVLDFGIAMMLRTVSTMASDATTRTELRPRMPALFATGGTPPYMSPEQLQGYVIDERSDIFSLGVVLFEMATGRRPFNGSDAQTMMRAQETPAPRAESIERRVPRRLGDIIARTLEVDLNQRYQSITDVEAGLEAVLRRMNRTNRDLIREWVPRVALAVPVIVLLIAFLGLVKTFGFNTNFGRTGAHARFGLESPAGYLRWGMLGIAPKLVVMTIMAAIVMAARIVLRGLALIGPIGRVMEGARRSARRLASATGLDKPSTLAQALAGLGVVLIFGLLWYFGDLVAAFQASFNSAPVEMLQPMRESARARGHYQLAFTIVTLVLGFGLFRVLQLRKRQRNREGRAHVAALGAVIAVAILLNEVPYRSFNYRDFERVELAGQRCYIIGESGDEFLVLCPRANPPRNRAVRRDDPQLLRPGIIENVFRGLNPVPPNP